MGILTFLLTLCLLVPSTVAGQRPKDATIQITPTTVTLSVGAVQQFTSAQTGSTKTPTWTATGGTITTTGRYTAGSIPGVYTVTVSLPANVRSSAKVTITAPPGADTTPPTVPTGLLTTLVTKTSFDFRWAVSTDAVGVVGYGVYLNGLLADTVTVPLVNFSGLTCGTSYALAVDAVDLAGNRSAKATLTAWTLNCDLPVDTTPPTVPTNLSALVTQTSVGLTWTASSDAVGVAGYGVYLNGALKQVVTGTAATISGLTCATPYMVAVDAVDVAGNRSATIGQPVTTVTCPTQIVTTVTFTPPTDYLTNVTSYKVELRRAVDPMTTAPIAVRDLGKPAPVSNVVSVNISTLVDPLPAGSYYASVTAIGPGGFTPSSPSLPFTK